jgi:hypothetical protein
MNQWEHSNESSDGHPLQQCGLSLLIGASQWRKVALWHYRYWQRMKLPTVVKEAE